MESGLEDRNNGADDRNPGREDDGLNGVRPRRPEQWGKRFAVRRLGFCLNGVRPRRPEQYLEARITAGQLDPVSMESGLEDRNNKANATVRRSSSLPARLNGVRPRRPEQWYVFVDRFALIKASQWSPA